jgi:hypothetical protein
MYEIARDQSYGSYPKSQLSLFSFHDAVELFLYISCEKNGINADGIFQFHQYFKKLEDKGIELTQRLAMNRLAKARNDLKHHGMQFKDSEFESIRVNVKNFFEENTKTIYGLEFSELSLVELISFDEVKENLKCAETLFEEDKIKEANDKIALAFFILIEDYTERNDGLKSDLFGSYLNILRSPTFEGELNRFRKDTIQSIKVLRDSVLILALGIDYIKYSEFKHNTPNVRRWQNKMIIDPLRVMKSEMGEEGLMKVWYIEKELSADELSFNLNFVIDSALKIQDLLK